jgi:sodium-dependent dicarboxylate transporter 2/3/5
VLWWVPRIGTEISLDRFDCGDGASLMLRQELESLGSMGAGERRVLIVFVSTVLLWLTRAPIEIGGSRFPGWAQLFADPGAIHDATVAVAAGIVLMVLRVPGGEQGDASVPVLDWNTVRRGVPWGILILFGGGFALARGFVETGLSEWMGLQLAGLGAAPLPIVILSVCLLTTFLTEVTSNTATSTVLMPVLAATAVAIDVEPVMLMIPAALSASCAFMLPVATPPNAVVFGSGWVSIQRMARVGLVMNLSGALVLTLVCWALVRFVV